MTVKELHDYLAEKLAKSPATATEQVILVIEPEDEDDPWYTATLTYPSNIHDMLPWKDEAEFILQLPGRDGQ